MKEDRLENFIRSNREAFDDKQPSEKVWAKIDRSLKPAVNLWTSAGFWRAAAVLFMALSLYLWVPKTVERERQEIALKEFKDVEDYYVRQISEKVDLIDSFDKNEGFNGFTQDFQQLEAMYYVLKEEMKNRPSQKVKDALVLNLLVQIDLLNQHLHKLEKDEEIEENAQKQNRNI